MELRVLPSPADVATVGATHFAAAARRAIASRGTFVAAVSGGRTPWLMFAELAGFDLPWDCMTWFQVDERIAPDGDPDRNWTTLEQIVGHLPIDLRPLPVTAPDLVAAAAGYAVNLPERFDLVHLGLGQDGHTASLLPGEQPFPPDVLVGVTGSYQGRSRLTLTATALNRGAEFLWLVTGTDKSAALAALLAGDSSIPASRVGAAGSLVLADTSAATSVPSPMV